MNLCKWCSSKISIGIGPVMRPDWKRWRCLGCGAIGYLKEPLSSELEHLYSDAWTDASNSGRFAAGSTNEEIAHSILCAIGWVPGKNSCLDYGAGKGELAKILLNRGANVVAFEPYGSNPNIPRLAWYRSWDEMNSNIYFEWVFLVEVIEHLLNPLEQLRTIRDRLAPGGSLVVTTPNARGWRSKIEGFKWREAQNPVHINLFSEKSLKICLEKSGFRDIRRWKPVKYNTSSLLPLMLSLTQMLGIDGGLRIVAKLNK